MHAEANEILAEQGLEYRGTSKLTHALLVFAQDVGLMVASSPLCFKSMNGTQAKALVQT